MVFHFVILGQQSQHYRQGLLFWRQVLAFAASRILPYPRSLRSG